MRCGRLPGVIIKRLRQGLRLSDHRSRAWNHISDTLQSFPDPRQNPYEEAIEMKLYSSHT
jgi:hypothetical protein